MRLPLLALRSRSMKPDYNSYVCIWVLNWSEEPRSSLAPLLQSLVYSFSPRFRQSPVQPRVQCRRYCSTSTIYQCPVVRCLQVPAALERVPLTCTRLRSGTQWVTFTRESISFFRMPRICMARFHTNLSNDHLLVVVRPMVDAAI